MATTPDPSTTEWVPLWDLNGIALSSVPPHHATHDTGGTDPLTSLSGTIITSGTIVDARLTVNVLKFTGGYPGGNTTFLRADGTFAVPPVPGPVGPHAATHSPGGGDTLINGVWTNVANVFTQDQILVGPAIGLILTDTSQPANLRGFSIRSTGQALMFQPVNDANNSVNGFVQINRNAALLAPNGLSSTPLNASNLTSGIVPAARLTNVAVLDVANIFSQPQRIIGTRPSWEVQFSGNPVISRIGQVVSGARIDITSNLYYDGANWNADDTSQASALYFQQSGYHYFYAAPAGANPKGATLHQEVIIDPNGVLTVPAGLGGTPLNASQITSGTVPIGNLPANVARTDIDNHFTAVQTIPSYSSITGGNSLLGFYDTAAGPDKKYWRFVNYTDGPLWLEALNDVQNTYIARFGFDRSNQFYGLLDAGQLNRGTIPYDRYSVRNTYLPTIAGTGNAAGEIPGQVYNFRSGFYVRNGYEVNVWSYTQFKGPADGGAAGAKGNIIGDLILRLPFPVGSSFFNLPFAAGIVSYYSNLGTPQDITGLSCYAPFGQSYALIKKLRSNGNNPIPMTGADVNDSTQLIIHISYFVD